MTSSKSSASHGAPGSAGNPSLPRPCQGCTYVSDRDADENAFFSPSQHPCVLNGASRAETGVRHSGSHLECSTGETSASWTHLCA